MIPVVITPSVGRPSLLPLARKVAELDLVHLIVFDMDSPPEIVKDLPESAKVLLLKDPTSEYGATQRDYAMDIARQSGFHCMIFIDDDNMIVEAGVNAIRALPQDNRIHLFCIERGCEILGAAPLDGYTFIDTAMIVLPTVPQLPSWNDFHGLGQDWYFYLSCKRILGDPIWHRECLAEVNIVQIS